MSFLEEFVGGTANLPGDLQQNYSLIRQLDEQQRELQKQMQVCCMQGLEDIKEALMKGSSPAADALASRYCNNIMSVHKTCVEVANEKVELAVSTYDMVDNYIQRLDKYLKKCKEECYAGKESQEDLAIDTGGSAGGQEQQPNTDIDLPVDPNEPTYCYCNQVSFGEMIACDNPDCKIEWFHFDCVGIKERPKGKWYCTDCSSLMKRRRIR